MQVNFKVYTPVTCIFFAYLCIRYFKQVGNFFDLINKVKIVTHSLNQKCH